MSDERGEKPEGLTRHLTGLLREAEMRAAEAAIRVVELSNESRQRGDVIADLLAALKGSAVLLGRISEWACESCPYHNRGPICTHCGEPEARRRNARLRVHRGGRVGAL